MADFARQDPIYVRGTQAPTDFVEAGKGVATFTTDGRLTLGRHRIPLRARGGSLRCLGEQAAIFKSAKHPEAVKLYLNWLLDK